MAAAFSWLQGVEPWKNGRRATEYFQAGGKGVAMRALAHAPYFAHSDEPASLIADGLGDGTTTQPTATRALVAATALAYSV